jgi:archaellum biogenesis ATPase FlaH
MALWDEVSANDKKGLFRSDDNTTSYPTGLLVLDYANGSWIEITNEKGEKEIIPSLGIPAGSLVSIIGSTGVGKSTLAIQIGWNIIKPFNNGMLIIEDCEKTNSRQRITNLVNAKYDEPRIKLIKSHTTIDDTLDTFTAICNAKEAGGKSFMYEVKNRSYDGKSFWMYEPTVFIIDSLPSFNGKDYNVESLGNQIDQMKASKDITRFYTNILDRAWKYNVIFIVINHIRPATNINPYAAPPQGLLMISPQTETLPRGSVPQYFSNTYFRIKTKKSAAYTLEDDGFTGYKCEIVLAKSKTNVVGTTFPVTFNNVIGFDPVYSIYEFANSLGLIKGRNPYLTLTGFEERKFNRKEFNSLMIADKDFREGFLRALKPYYEVLLGSKKISEDDIEDIPVVPSEIINLDEIS